MKLQFLDGGSPDCPLIRLFSFDQTQAVRLVEIFNQLSEGTLEELSLHREPGIQPVGGCALLLRCGKRDIGIVQKEPMQFECILTKEAWSDAAERTKPFSKSGRSDSFQWLNETSE